MTTTSDVLTTLQNALAADTELGDWCLATFSNRGSIYTGIDQKKPAPAEHYPIVAVVEIRESKEARHSWEVTIGCGIIQETIDEAAGPPRTVSYRGLGQAETFREQVEAALRRGRFAKLDFSGHSEPLNYYPLFVSFTVATVSVVRRGRRQ